MPQFVSRAAAQCRPRYVVAIVVVAFALASAQPAIAADKEKKTKVTIYPILVQAPIFGASIDLPSLPGGGGGSGGGGESNEQRGETDISLNGAALFGFRVDAKRWFGEFNGTWADVSAERELPLIRIDSDTRLYSARGGVGIGGGFFVTGGFRRVASELSATLTTGNQTTISGKAKPALWDPLIGVDWRGEKGRFTFDTSFEGGGFGVGTDVELAGDAHVDWEIFPHFALRAGYSILYYKMTLGNVSIGSFQRTLITKQTLNGPSVGIGIVF